jgi:anti-sigma factor RsiW
MNHPSEEQLNEYLDHESEQQAQIESHIAACDECMARLTALQTLFVELDSLPEMALSRDLASSVIQRVGRSGVLPKWLTLTLALQAALALVSTLVAAPAVIEFLSQAVPAFQSPSIPQAWIQLQTLWMNWLNSLSKIQVPSLPEIAAPQFSSLAMLGVLASASFFWLVGNGLLLRNQIK